MANADSTKHRKNFTDLTSQRFERLLVLRFAGYTTNSSSLWECRCDCGKTVVRQGSNLRSGSIRSCGCLRRELHIERITKHGESRSKEYCAWNNAVHRCHNPANKQYPDYGARGIVVCERWRDSFENFLADMGRAPSRSHSLERLDNDGPYSPENCTWILGAVQARNKRSNHLLTLNGETKTMVEWSEITGLSQGLLRARKRYGWSDERTLTTPLRSPKKELPPKRQTEHSRKLAERNYRHGLSKTLEYGIWTRMIQRCYNPRAHQYKDYGGRGITVCDRWRESVANFIADMGFRPSPQSTLERIDNDGPYCPENCRWATRKEQANNTRRNRHQKSPE